MLQEDSGLLTVLWDNSVIGLAIVHPDGSFKQVNPAFSEITGYTESELQDRNFQALTDARDVNDDVASLRALLEKKIPFYFMVKRYIHKRGFLVWVELRVDPLPDGLLLAQVVESPLIPQQVGRAAPAVKKEYPIVAALKKNWTWVVGALVALVFFVSEQIANKLITDADIQRLKEQLEELQKDGAKKSGR